jgi:hypothetical protein
VTAGGGTLIEAGVNDKIDFVIGATTYVATVAPGFYALADDLALAINDALEAQFPTLSAWVASYDPGNNRWSLGSYFFSPTFKFSTGANAATDIAQTLGFTATDLTGGNVYEATNPPIAAIPQSFTAALAAGHNVSVTGVIRLDAETVSMLTMGLDSPFSYTTPLLGTDVRADYFAEKSYRFVRIVIDDVQNPEGFNEVAIVDIGPSIAPEGLQGPGFVKRNEQLSTRTYAVGGAHHMTRRRRRRVWTMQWKLFSQAEEDVFDALDEALPAGSNFFLTFDDTDPGNTVYGFLVEGLTFERQLGELRYMSMTFAEALD